MILMFDLNFDVISAKIVELETWTFYSNQDQSCSWICASKYFRRFKWNFTILYKSQSQPKPTDEPETGPRQVLIETKIGKQFVYKSQHSPEWNALAM